MRSQKHMWRFRKILPREPKIQMRNWFVLQIKCSSLLIDRNKNYLFCSACADCARHEVLGKLMQWRLRCRRKASLFSKSSTLRFLAIATHLTVFLAHGWEVRGMNFQENPSIRRRDAKEKTLCSPSNVPFVTGRAQPNQRACSVCRESARLKVHENL